jgi:hypothetical protein
LEENQDYLTKKCVGSAFRATFLNPRRICNSKNQFLKSICSK